MIGTLPSPIALRAFEAAARHLSFTRAASELNVTQAAISHQIKALETELGVRLFLRLTRRLGRLRRLDRRDRRMVNDGHGQPSNEIHPSSTNRAIASV